MKPTNLLIIMSDQHNNKMLGCHGHPIVRTPNLDALAARGTDFTDAYTTCPVCVPARAAFAIGKYVHQIGYWDNADAYEGSVLSWHHRLRARGHRVVSIGKLHFRGHTGDDNGFSEEIIPMNILEGKGDLMGLVLGRLVVEVGEIDAAHGTQPRHCRVTDPLGAAEIEQCRDGLFARHEAQLVAMVETLKLHCATISGARPLRQARPELSSSSSSSKLPSGLSPSTMKPPTVSPTASTARVAMPVRRSAACEMKPISAGPTMNPV